MADSTAPEAPSPPATSPPTQALQNKPLHIVPKPQNYYSPNAKTIFFHKWDTRAPGQSMRSFIQEFKDKAWCPNGGTAGKFLKQRQRLLDRERTPSPSGRSRGRPRKDVEVELDGEGGVEEDGVVRGRHATMTCMAQQAGVSVATLRRRMKEGKIRRPPLLSERLEQESGRRAGEGVAGAGGMGVNGNGSVGSTNYPDAPPVWESARADEFERELRQALGS